MSPLVVTHARVAETPADPGADVSTSDWNAEHIITGDLDPGQIPALPDFPTFFSDADSAGNPAGPQNLSGYAGFTQVLLSWDMPAEALWRTWEIAEGATADFTPAAPYKATNGTVISIAKDSGTGPYFFKVRAVNSRGEYSDWSAAVGPFTTQSVGSIALGPGQVLAENLAELAIDLAGSKVTGQVGPTQISDNAIISQHIAAGSVIAGKIGANAVVANNILAGAIGTDHLAASAVTAEKIIAGAIVADKIAAGAITAEKIQANAVTADKIVAAAITAGKIAASAVTATAVAAGTLTAGHLAAGTITAASACIQSLNADKLTSGKITAVDIEGVNITGAYIKTSLGLTRVEMHNDHIYFYDGDSADTPGEVSGEYQSIYSGFGRGLAYLPAITIVAPHDPTWVSTTPGRILVTTGQVQIDGLLKMQNGAIIPSDWGSGTSADGIWIQDNYDTTNRVKIYYNSSNRRLGVYDGGTAHYITLSA